MTARPGFPDGIWAVDFEFHPSHGREGNPPHPVCMVALDLQTGKLLRLWRHELESLDQAPFPVGKDALMVAYLASAEISCFLALGWPLPANTLDLYAEFVWLTNGLPLIHGKGLLGALQYFGLTAMGSYEKEEMKALVLTRGPWTPQQEAKILTYCESDVVALQRLLPAMSERIDWPRALLRGGFMKSVARIETTGVPIDVQLFERLTSRWLGIQDELVSEIDSQFGVYERRTFKMANFEKYLADRGLNWPRLASGTLALKDQTFKDMARAHPELKPLRELRRSLASMRLSGLTIGTDGRNRCLLSPFGSKTGRNQPSIKRSIFGHAAWMRGLIRPPPGRGLAYVDYCQQEFGIAAALSKDEKMMEAYRSGDPYLAFAKQAGAVPQDATKTSHPAEREKFKACALAVLYGMGGVSLALRVGLPKAYAEELLRLHRRTYVNFWKFSDRVVDEACLNRRLGVTFGWQVNTSDELNDRSLRNFPMQANGAEMLRIACVLLHDASITVCTTIHDAILIEAPLEELDQAVATTQALMRRASEYVLDGFGLSSDSEVIRYPDRYMAGRKVDFWNTVMRILGEPLHR